MYEQQILKILNDAGENGLKVAKIARHVYNDCNTLFEPHSLEEIHKAVLAFLMKNAKSKDPLVEKLQWGVYRLNTNSNRVCQLIMQFDEDNQQAERKSAAPSVDLTLSLFEEQGY
jgi:hypothetical protein